MSLYTDTIKVKAVVSVQFDRRTPPAAWSADDPLSGTITTGVDYGNTTMSEVFDGQPGVLNHAGTVEEARWIITNLSHQMPILWELEINDFEQPGNTIVNTYTETVVVQDRVEFILTAPADTYREVTTLTDYQCPA